MGIEQAQPNANAQSVENQDRTAGAQSDALDLTQDALNSLIANERRKERARLLEQYGDYDDLKKKASQFDELKQAELSELEKLQQQLAAKDQEVAAAKQQAETERLNALRLRVGQEYGYAPTLAARLQGTTEDEIRADAESLKAVVGQGGQVVSVPNIDASAGGGQSRQSSVKLTPSQREAGERAVRGGLYKSLEEYAEALQDQE